MIDKDHLLDETSLSNLGEVAFLPNAQKPTQRVKENEEQRDVFQTEEQDKSPETDVNNKEIGDWPNTEFEIIVLKLLTEIRRMIHKQINKDYF